MSKKLNGRNVKWFPNGESLATTIAESVEISIYGITPSSAPAESIPGGFGYGTLFVVGGRGNQGYGYAYAIYNGSNATGSRISAIYDKGSGWNEYAQKSDLYPSYDQITLFSDVKADVTDKNITITENGMVQVAAKTQATDGTAFIRLVINGACVYEGHTVSGKYRYLWTPIFPVKKGDIIKVTLQTGTTDGQRFVYFYKS